MTSPALASSSTDSNQPDTFQTPSQGTRVKLNSLSEHLDPDTTLGRAMMHIAAIFAEMERSNIRERTREGVKAARERGVKFGRKPKLTPQQIDHARELLGRKNPPRREEIAELFKVNRTTLYRALSA